MKYEKHQKKNMIKPGNNRNNANYGNNFGFGETTAKL